MALIGPRMELKQRLWGVDAGCMTARVYTDQIAQEAAELYRQGHSMADIARRYSVTTQAVHKWLKRLEVPRRNGATSPVRREARQDHLAEIRRQILDDYAAGRSLRVIRARAHMSYPTVRRILVEGGVDVDALRARSQTNRRIFGPAVQAEWRERHAGGATMAELAREYYVSDRTVRRAIFGPTRADGDPR